MVNQICLLIIATALVALVAVLIKISLEVQRAANAVQTDLQKLSLDTQRLLNSLNDFIRVDLHHISQVPIKPIPKIFQWMGTGFHLIKTTKEFIKNYGK